ncbi:hypothetical protein JOF53_000131 [Crossiella equi]|uniref:Hemerythrin-like domain-containing protein n=1 Tax=Crossiella equi TaxID=130796 RepID=A0ABS5A3V0_9PSEU|nr:hemerythrin domain-containing protein [Crossiella equi]MBP2471259.1 hypothetical protein [Crossiella equi]
MTTTRVPLADTRDMYMIHTAFRREFGLAPDLVRAVPAGEVARARVVADHVELLDEVLHHHHGAEDRHLWPRLLARVPQAVAPLVHTMESQHQAIDDLHTELRTALAAWRTTADPVRGLELAGVLERLLPLLTEHLELEERHVLPLIGQHVTAAEWDAMVAEAGATLDPGLFPLVFGMCMYEGEPEVVAYSIANMPPELRPVLAGLATEAFRAHSLRVHGTGTPPRVLG